MYQITLTIDPEKIPEPLRRAFFPDAQSALHVIRSQVLNFQSPQGNFPEEALADEQATTLA